jgi:hypothetical protein
MNERRSRAVLTALAVAGGTIVLQCALYVFSEPIGDASLWAGLAALAYAAWLLGGVFHRGLTWIAVLTGILFGTLFWYFNWLAVRFVRVDVLHQFNEHNERWLATGFWFLLWPAIIIGGVAAAVGAWRVGRDVPPAAGA